MSYLGWRRTSVRVAFISHACLGIYWLVVFVVAFIEYRASGIYTPLAAAWVVALVMLLIPIIAILVATVSSFFHWVTLILVCLLWIAVFSFFDQPPHIPVAAAIYVLFAIPGALWWVAVERQERKRALAEAAIDGELPPAV